MRAIDHRLQNRQAKQPRVWAARGVNERGMFYEYKHRHTHTNTNELISTSNRACRRYGDTFTGLCTYDCICLYQHVRSTHCLFRPLERMCAPSGGDPIESPLSIVTAHAAAAAVAADHRHHRLATALLL